MASRMLVSVSFFCFSPADGCELEILDFDHCLYQDAVGVSIKNKVSQKAIDQT